MAAATYSAGLPNAKNPLLLGRGWGGLVSSGPGPEPGWQELPLPPFLACLRRQPPLDFVAHWAC